MKALVECLIAWLQEERSNLKAWRILDTLARETLKRAESQDAEQRVFEVLDIAEACEPDIKRNHDSAKTWFTGGKPANFLLGRRAKLEDYFSKAGHRQGLKLSKRESKGKNQSVWFFTAYDMQTAEMAAPNEHVDVIDEPPTKPILPESDIVYEVTKPGEIKLNWIGRILLGKGAFITRSGRG